MKTNQGANHSREEYWETNGTMFLRESHGYANWCAIRKDEEILSRA